MLEKLRMLITPPSFLDEDESVISKMIFYVILFGAPTTVVLVTVLLPFHGFHYGTAALLILLSGFLVSFIFLKYRRLYPASSILFGAVLATLLIAAYFGDGIKDTSNLLLVFSILFSVYVFSKRMVFIYTSIGLLLYGGVTFLSEIYIQKHQVGINYWTNLGVVVGFVISSSLIAVKFNELFKKSLLEKKEGYEKLDLIAKKLSIGIITFNRTHLTYVNRFMEVLTGYTKAELLSMPFIKLIHPEESEMLMDRISRSFNDEAVSKGREYRLIKKDGTIHWIYITTGIYRENNSYLGISGVIDIQRFNELEQQNIRMKKSELLSRFAGGLAHELNNDLSALVGSISLASRYLTNNKIEKAEASLVSVKEAVDRVKGITNRIIYFAKGGVAGHKTLVNPRSVIENVLEKFKNEYPSASVTTRINAVLNETKINIAEVENALLGILKNSMEASGNGSTIMVSAENIVIKDKITLADDVLTPGEYIRLMIKDNGPGILPDEITKVLDPYYSSKESGKGLGLSLALSVMRLHGGTLALDSDGERGLAVHMYIPADPPS